MTWSPSSLLAAGDANNNGAWNGINPIRDNDWTSLAPYGASGDIPFMNNIGEFGVYRPSTGMWYTDVDGLGWWNGGSPCDGVRERCEGPWGGQAGDQPFVDAHNRPGIFRNGT